MYVNGRGVPQDYIEAHKWFNLAAAQKVEPDIVSSEDCTAAIKNRDALASTMTGEQIAEAQKRASEWRPMR